MNYLPEDEINPGILLTVKWLRSMGHETIDSGDGYTHDHECDLPMPYVHMQCQPCDLVYRVLSLRSALLNVLGLECYPTPEEDDGRVFIEASYNPADEYAHYSLYNVRIR